MAAASGGASATRHTAVWRTLDGDGKGPDIDVERIREALHLVEEDRLNEAASALGPLVKGKRFTRASRMNPEAEEIDEVKAWLAEIIADPSSPDARFLVERAYYKLRTQRPAETVEDGRGSQRSR